MKLFDCIFCDGGYYINWDFDQNFVVIYLDVFNQLLVEYFEVGYWLLYLLGYLGEFFYCLLYVLVNLWECFNKKLVVIFNEKDVCVYYVVELLGLCKFYLDVVCLVVDLVNFSCVFIFGKVVKDFGFDLCFNVMYMFNWEEYFELMDNMLQLDGLVDYFYMVDLFGGVYLKDVV